MKETLKFALDQVGKSTNFELKLPNFHASRQALLAVLGASLLTACGQNDAADDLTEKGAIKACLRTELPLTEEDVEAGLTHKFNRLCPEDSEPRVCTSKELPISELERAEGVISRARTKCEGSTIIIEGTLTAERGEDYPITAAGEAPELPEEPKQVVQRRVAHQKVVPNAPVERTSLSGKPVTPKRPRVLDFEAVKTQLLPKFDKAVADVENGLTTGVKCITVLRTSRTANRRSGVGEHSGVWPLDDQLSSPVQAGRDAHIFMALSLPKSVEPVTLQTEWLYHDSDHKNVVRKLRGVTGPLYLYGRPYDIPEDITSTQEFRVRWLKGKGSSPIVCSKKFQVTR